MREIIFLLALGSASGGMSLRIVEPMLPRLAADFGTSVSAAAVVITAFAIGYALGQALHGPLGDRIGKLRVVTVALAGGAACTMASALAGGVASLVALRLLTALFVSASTTLGVAYIGDSVPIGERQPVVARFIAGTIIGQALGPLLGGVFTDLFGWKGAFLAVGGLFAVVPLLWFVRTARLWAGERRAPASGALFSAYLPLAKIPRVRYVCAAAFADAFLFFGAYSFLGAFFKERFDLSYSAVGAILSGFGVGGILYILAVRPLLRVLGQGWMAAVGGMVCFGFYVLIATAPLAGFAFACTVVLGFSFFMLHNTVQVKATEMAPQARGAGVAAFASLWSLGQALGVAVMGASIAHFDYSASIAAFGLGFAILGLWMRMRLDRL
ncbi:MAG: MFS transporter [Burkholderiales bacterium]|nr:MFS transporter [Burkholderiales bacterium]